MGRFDHLATRPPRGPSDIFRWKVIDPLAGRVRKNAGGFVTPTRPFDRELVASASDSLTWIGHATFLLTLGGRRFLTDPLFRPRLGPVRRLAAPGISVDELPRIDAVLVSHNHRDHLDTWSIARLGPEPTYVVPLGNGLVVGRAGARNVIELDWWESAKLGDTQVTLVPARHWSMRLPWDRNEALWGGFVVAGPGGTAYHSGDTAYFDGFAEIACRAGPIDWAMLPIGAYEPRWFMAPQHMNPEEAADAAIALGARAFVAMHWGTFRLTDEPPGEPPERARAAWHARGRDADSLWILDVGETRPLTR